MTETASSDLRLLAACGLYCGACYHYRAAFPEGSHLLTDAARGGRSLAGFACGGCWSDRLYTHSGCLECEIRACTQDRGIQHCGDCGAFPCDRLRAFEGDGRVHHLSVVANLRAVARIGVDVWLRDQSTRWRCEACGSPHSWYETTCNDCGAALRSSAADVPQET